MCTTAKHLNCRIKGRVEVCEDYATAKIKHKFLHKVAEVHDLKPGKMICIDIGSQKKPSYEVSNNWVIIKDCDTKQKWSLFTKKNNYQKNYPFLEKNEEYEEKYQNYLL